MKQLWDQNTFGYFNYQRQYAVKHLHDFFLAQRPLLKCPSQQEMVTFRWKMAFKYRLEVSNGSPAIEEELNTGKLN